MALASFVVLQGFHSPPMKKSILTSLVALALSAGALHAADAILTGNYLKVGVNNSGGLIDSSFNVGITYDKTGTATFPPYDFLKPGTPYEFGAVGYNSNSATFGYYDGNTIGGTTTDTSAGTTLSTNTVATWNSLSITQNMWFSKDGGTIYFDVKLKNISTDLLSNVVYARGLDPDQDVYAGGSYDTNNSIVSGDLVTGSAPTTDWTIGIFSDSTFAHTPTIRSAWPYGDPYGLLTPRNDGNGDYSINMAWNIGSLAAGATADVTFQYRIAPTKDEVVTPPGTGVPDAASTLGLTLGALGLLGLIRRRR